jgi:casein kinase 1
MTTHSGAAHVGVPPPNRMSSSQHPYANPGGYDYGATDDPYRGQQYGRASPMVTHPSAAPPALSDPRGRNGQPTGEFAQHGEDPAPQSGFLRILTCRC